jgi:predicted site-specific integrase-resolvase
MDTMSTEQEPVALLNIRAAAQQLGIDLWTLQKHIGFGTVVATHIGRLVFVREDEIRRIKEKGLPTLAIAAARAAERLRHRSDLVDASLYETSWAVEPRDLAFMLTGRRVRHTTHRRS